MAHVLVLGEKKSILYASSRLQIVGLMEVIHKQQRPVTINDRALNSFKSSGYYS